MRTTQSQRDPSQSLPLTVTGSRLRESYDVVLAHEHLLIDTRCYLEQGSDLEHQPVTPALRERLAANSLVCADNLVLDDVDIAADELSYLGGVNALVIDVTPENIGRDPARLVAISERTGVDVLMGCGPYVGVSHSEEDRARSEDAWHGRIVADLTRPVPRAAVIGEIGTSDPIEPSERRALIGAIRAQRDTGAPLYVHLHPFGTRGHEVLDLVERYGGDVARTVLCHLDGQIPNGLSYHRSLLDRGCLIAFDVWGFASVEAGGRWATDTERVGATVELVADGYVEQLLFSQDVCQKTQLRRFGGPGYDHIWLWARPALGQAGLDDATVTQLLSGNGLRLLGGAPSV
jgi:phosphotriesterase-related protein